MKENSNCNHDNTIASTLVRIRPYRNLNNLGALLQVSTSCNGSNSNNDEFIFMNDTVIMLHRKYDIFNIVNTKINHPLHIN